MEKQEIIVYDLSVKVDLFTEKDWIEWAQKVYISKALKTGHFTTCQVFKFHRNEQGGKTYVLRLFSKSFEDIESYLDKEEPSLIAEQTEKFRGKLTYSKKYYTFLDEIKIEDLK